jgi:beta-mannosidase
MTRVSALFLMTVLLASAGPSDAAPSPAPRGGRLVIALDKNWTFRKSGAEQWLPATVPGSVHTDLLANKQIPDPFYRDNEQSLQWIGKADWEYRTTFDVAADALKRERVELVFEGLDTYATVLLNDTKLLEADNMFRRWRVDCKGALKPGSNALVVRFRSPINEILPVMKKLSYELPASNDQGEKTSPHTRKAPYQYGWDWGPRFVTCGVWRPARIEAWDAARIEDVHVTQEKLAADGAELTARVTVEAARPGNATVVVDSPDRAFGQARKSVALVAGRNVVAIPVRVERPKLWWPNGLGEQPLYAVRARVDADGSTDERATRVGLRTLEVRQTPDEWGKSFAFYVNGVPVFAKGGNWIPADSFPERVTPERYRHLLDSCRRANMNMLRTWGGGYYEEDVFYDLCDEMGILVWQDFMFACSMYPGDEAFLESVRAEATDNVVRLRNHPSIALWCGNNEVETAWLHWGWKDKLPASLWDDYKKLFHGVLPAVCAENDPSRLYWPSSPTSNLEDDPDSQRIGDVHYWAVWHFAKPFQEYELQFPRFMSEYGFQSFPLLETVSTYALPNEWDIESPVMKAHQKHPRGNQLIREYMLREYVEPKDFPSFLYVSQVLQAEGIRVAAEHLRRQMPRTMGSLYWQIDDCWPVASWSGMDYFGRWKALQYYARRFYEPVLLSTSEAEGKIHVTVVSDRVEPAKASLRMRLVDFSGRVLWERSSDVDVAPVKSTVLASLPVGELTKAGDAGSAYLLCELTGGPGARATTRRFFKPYKDLSLPTPKLTTDVTGAGKEIRVAVASDSLARAVYLSLDGADALFSDNFFDVDAKGRVEVRVETPGLTLEDVRKRLRVRSLADAFK